MQSLESMLPGTWFIKGTTFPMWLSSKRQNPAITYTLKDEKGVAFDDLVTYTVKGKTKAIKGVDRFQNNQFIWRGNGVLKVLTSRWRILYIDDTVLVITFEKSFVTPAGMDVLIKKEKADIHIQNYLQQHVIDKHLPASTFEPLTWLD